MRRLFGSTQESGVVRGAERDGVDEALRAASRRFDEVVAAARSAAEDIGAEARTRLDAGGADTPSREQVAAELLETLAARAQGLRREAEEVARILARAAGQLGSSADGPINGGGDGTGGHAASKGMRLLIAQMTAAGSGRKEIAERLRQDFGVDDAGEILDDVLGPAGG
jgi:hypothetical protein